MGGLRMREAKIRFGAALWNLIQEEASRDGVSASQFVREAAMVRAVVYRMRRGEDYETEYLRILDRLRSDLNLPDE